VLARASPCRIDAAGTRGYVVGDIVEICSPPGAGKTRVRGAPCINISRERIYNSRCMQLCMKTIAEFLLVNRQASALYVASSAFNYSLVLKEVLEEALTLRVCTLLRVDALPTIDDLENRMLLATSELLPAARISLLKSNDSIEGCIALEAMEMLRRVTIVTAFDAYTLLNILSQLNKATTTLATATDAIAMNHVPDACDDAFVMGSTSFRASIRDQPGMVWATERILSFEPDPRHGCVVCIDSLSMLIAPVLGSVRNMAGHALMFEVGRALRLLAEMRNALILVTNTTLAEKHELDRHGTSSGLRAALGQAWPIIPDVRVLLEAKRAAVTAEILKHRSALPLGHGHIGPTSCGEASPTS
jgi:hypothetical protein